MFVVGAVEETMRGALVGDDLSAHAAGSERGVPLGDGFGRDALVGAAHQTEDGALDLGDGGRGRRRAIEAFGGRATVEADCAGKSVSG